GCADTKIGIPGSVKGLSCGEQKRLSFASESIRNEFRRTPQGQEVKRISERKMDENAADRVKSEKDRSFLNMLYPASFCAQTRALTWRSWLTVTRDPMLLNVRLIQTI
ncbi:hypothetical protein GCK32_017984, partial [Trichostrongylus colubriformis]